jgi:hypothetical protein
MDQCPSWEANRFTASQEIPRILWNPKVHYRINISPQPIPIIGSAHVRGLCSCFVTKPVLRWGVAVLRPTPKLEDHPSSAVRHYLFNIFAATLHIGRLSSIRNLRTRHAVVTGTHLSHVCYICMRASPHQTPRKNKTCYADSLPHSHVWGLEFTFLIQWFWLGTNELPDDNQLLIEMMSECFEVLLMCDILN